MRQTILLVDDDPARLNLLARLIKQAGFRTVTARIGPSGVSFPEHEQPVLVLLDYGSGSERNARDIAALIRLQYGSTRLVLLSSRSSLPAEMAGLVDEFAHRDGAESVLSALKQWLIRGRSAGQGAE